LDKLFNLYLQELVAWNEKFNLTAITDPDEIRRKHFEDSLLLLQVIKLTNEAVIDVGAGAGFPGLPLKIACPGIRLTLLDATRKKVNFMDHIIKTLGLKNTVAVWGRAEKYAEDHREKFDVAVSRATAKLNLLCEYCLPFLKVGGQMFAYKGERIEEEIKAAEPALRTFGGELKEVRRFPMRSLVIIEKKHPV
jgi:16S rRNA (guanine527-N7)-methyltransferase